MLAATQRHLSSLALGPLKRHALWNLLPCLQPWPPSLDNIIIPWELFLPQDINFYQQTIERCAKPLRALTVRARSANLDDELVDISSNELARRLFKHLLPPSERPKQILYDLNLQGQKLEGADETWLKFIDFTQLRTLEIWYCDNADALLSCLIELAQLGHLRLLGLVVTFDGDGQPPHLIEEYLTASSSLQYLNMDYGSEYERQSRFDVKCLRPHSDSIKDLLLGLGGDPLNFDPLQVLSLNDFEWLTTNCLGLRQLAVALPPLRLDAALAGRWGKCEEVLVMMTCFYIEKNYADFRQNQLASLPALKVLRILTWPLMCSPVNFEGQDSRHLAHREQENYFHDLDIVADSIARLFQRIRGENQQRLSVITFGTAEHSPYISNVNSGRLVMSSGEPMTYKIERRITEYGYHTVTKRIDARLMKYVEPTAHVFDEDTD